MTNRALEKLRDGLALQLAAVEELIAAPDPEEWVDQVRSPLGRRRHCELARRGVLPGARKSGGQWFVKRKALDAFLDGERAGDASAAAEEAKVLAFKARPRRRASR